MCGKYRCNHQIFRGRIEGHCGRSVAVQDPAKIMKLSEFSDKELQNFSPKLEAIDILMGVNTSAKVNTGYSLAEF
jgi:hypothetical protein